MEIKKMETKEIATVNPNIKSIFVEGRLWFDKTGGNTYHSVRIEINGQTVKQIGLTYGYEHAYQDTALVWLKSYGLVSEDVRSLFELRSHTEIYTVSYYTLKRELWKSETVKEQFSKLLFIEELKKGI